MPFRASTDPPSGKFVCRSQKAHLAKANQSFLSNRGRQKVGLLETQARAENNKKKRLMSHRLLDDHSIDLSPFRFCWPDQCRFRRLFVFLALRI